MTKPYLHTKRIIFYIIEKTSELNSLLKVNVDGIIPPVVEFSHVNLVNFSADDGEIFPLNEDSFLINHHFTVDIDVVKLDLGNPNLFVLLRTEGIILIFFLQVLKLEVLVKPLDVDHEVDVEGSLHVVNLKDLQDNEGHVDVQ